MSRSLRASDEGIKEIKKPISLRASDEGIKKIKKAIKQVGFNQTSFAEHLKISRSTMTSLFQGKGIKRDTFQELCKFLELDWEDIRGEDVVSDDIDLLVKAVKQKIAADVIERCGTMRVLDMTQPIDLDRIYTDVNIIKDLSGRMRISYEEIMQVGTREHFDRFLVGDDSKTSGGT
jgi:DNA-binding Xre family transcriptional regulator